MYKQYGKTGYEPFLEVYCTSYGPDETGSLYKEPGQLRVYGSILSTSAITASGNVTAGGTVSATRISAGYTPTVDNSIGCSNWFRSSGDTGWYNATYGGGWYMSDTTYIRAYNNKGIYTTGAVATNQIAFITGSGYIYSPAAQQVIFRASAEDNYRLFYGVTSSDWRLCPYVDKYLVLGGASNRWKYIYSSNGTVQTSDERDKDILGAVDSRYKQLYMQLAPIVYRWKDDQDTKVHIGLGAQTTERSAQLCGITDTEMGMIMHDYWDEPSADGRIDRYGMNYQEIAVLTVPIVQEHEKRLNSFDIEFASVERRQDTQEAQIESLQEQLSDARIRLAEQAAEIARLKGQLESVA